MQLGLQDGISILRVNQARWSEGCSAMEKCGEICAVESGRNMEGQRVPIIFFSSKEITHLSRPFYFSRFDHVLH